MAITREKKGALVAEYVDKLRRSQALIVTEYRGLGVKQMEALRRELRAADSELVVTKNTLVAKAMTEVGMPVPKQLLKGPIAVTFCFSELASPAKTLNKFAKDTKILVVRGGVLGSSVLDADGAQSLADLPGRDELRAKVVGVLQSPITGLVNVLSGSLRGFVTVLKARADQLEKAA